MSRAPRSHDGDRSTLTRSHSCDLLLQDLKDAMRETGWTPDALAKHYDVDRSYIVRCLQREKPLTAERLADLPSDLADAYEAKRAERRGLIVVAPLNGLAAQKALVAGLIGIMSQPLPARADRMAKAEPPERREVVNS